MRRRGVLGTIALLLVIVIMLGVIGGAVYLGIKTDWYTDWSIFAQKPNEGGEDTPDEGKEDGTVQDGEGAALTSGAVYELPKALVYTARTAQSSDAGEGIRVTATVTPSTAINKNVTWGVAFADSQSEWATGKTVADYFTAVPEQGNPNTVVLTCLEPFGERIILTATSVQDFEKSASCTVDFQQKITNVSLNIGNVPVHLGGETNVAVDITQYNAYDNEKGGRVALNYDLTDTYTLPDKIVKKSVVFTHQDHDLSGEWFSYAIEMGAGRSIGIEYRNIPDDSTESATSAEGFEIYFDLRFLANSVFRTYTGSTGNQSYVDFVDMGLEELATLYRETTYVQNNGEYTAQRKNTKLWDICVTIETEKGIRYESTSALHWTSCTGVNISIDNESVVM